MKQELKQLMEAPLANLENRITELKTELIERLKLKEKVLQELEWEKGKLDSEINAFRGYFINPENSRMPFVMKKIDVEHMMLNEEINCFRDTAILKDKIRTAVEQLFTEKMKQGMIYGRS